MSDNAKQNLVENRDTNSNSFADVRMRWGVRIPLGDGVHLNATLYLPQDHRTPTPAILTLTPYVGQTYHDRGLYFAAHGYPFLTVDVRGRGNSEGVFKPNINEAKDGYDVVEWLARQPYCNGQVAMWGGSYAGLNQWNTAREVPPHLGTIAPVAAPYIGVDFPIYNNIAEPYWIQWLTLVAGRTSQDKMFWNSELFWGAKFRRWFESGNAFNALETMFDCASPIFQEWVEHPHQDLYWDSYNPTSEQYAKLSIPILTITGAYDGNQPGALTHYREYMKHTSEAGRAITPARARRRQNSRALSWDLPVLSISIGCISSGMPGRCKAAQSRHF
jgi:putative CocE/NonD family hydrolase